MDVGPDLVLVDGSVLSFRHSVNSDFPIDAVVGLIHVGGPIIDLIAIMDLFTDAFVVDRVLMDGSRPPSVRQVFSLMLFISTLFVVIIELVVAVDEILDRILVDGSSPPYLALIDG